MKVMNSNDCTTDEYRTEQLKPLMAWIGSNKPSILEGPSSCNSLCYLFEWNQASSDNCGMQNVWVIEQLHTSPKTSHHILSQQWQATGFCTATNDKSRWIYK
jgi:hypothetical protein